MKPSKQAKNSKKTTSRSSTVKKGRANTLWSGVFATRTRRLTGLVVVTLIFGGVGLYLLLRTMAVSLVDTPITGDWNGDGKTTIGAYRGNSFLLRNSNSGGAADVPSFSFGTTGDVPITGDWDGNGTTTIGVYRPSNRAFYLRNSNTSGSPSIASFSYGTTGDVPITGDWNGDGKTTIGVYRPSNHSFYLRNSNSGGSADIGFSYGTTGDVPITGDWNGDGKTTIGVKRGKNTIYLRNSNTGGGSDIPLINYGAYGDIPISGDWDGNGTTTVGVYRPSEANFYLRDSNSSTYHTTSFHYGMATTSSSGSTGTTVGSGTAVGGGYNGAQNCVSFMNWVLPYHVTGFSSVARNGVDYAAYLRNSEGWGSKKAVHSVVSFTSGTSSSAGHVALIYQVNSDGSVWVEHSNWGCYYCKTKFSAYDLANKYHASYASPPNWQ